MKKLLGILVLGLLWCNVSLAETEQSIRDKYKSELPNCEDGGITVDMKDTEKWMKWDNCFGRLKIESDGTSIIVESEIIDGYQVGKGSLIVGPEASTFPGETFFVIRKKLGCKRNAHSIDSEGKLYKIKWNKTCDNVIKRTPIK